MKKKRKKNVFIMVLFILGLVLYLVGLFLLFGFGISNSIISDFFFSNLNLNESSITNLKIIGAILFIIGFLLFMISVIILYKNDDIQEDNINLIIEGKADVITIMIMTYVMIFMVVICLLCNELIGALLFGVAIIVQSFVNWVLIKYYNNTYRKK